MKLLTSILRASNANASNISTGTRGGLGVSNGILNNDLITDNTKLRKQLTIMKKELHDNTIAFEKYRIDSVKEIGKWKSKGMRVPSVSTDLNVSNSLDIYLPQGSGPEIDDDQRNEIRNREIDLKRRILALERDLSAAKAQNRNGSQAGFRNSTRSSRSNTPPSEHLRNRRGERDSGGSGSGNDSDRQRDINRGRGSRSVSSGTNRRVSSSNRKSSLLHSPTSASRLREREKERGVSGYNRYFIV